MAPGEVFQILQGQNAVLAYNDVFFISGLLALLLVPIGLFMSTVTPKARSGE
jgi:DHA2 family multidrug resistance protein